MNPSVRSSRMWAQRSSEHRFDVVIDLDLPAQRDESFFEAREAREAGFQIGEWEAGHALLRRRVRGGS